MIQFVYKAFIGILLATTIGMGIAAFYPAPEPPKYPEEKFPIVMEDTDTSRSAVPAGNQEEMKNHERLYQEYTAKKEVYDRNTALIAISFALAILAISLTALAKVEIIADGLVLGGILTLLYGVAKSFGSNDEKMIFIASLVGLITALGLGYLHFIRTNTPAKKRK